MQRGTAVLVDAAPVAHVATPAPKNTRKSNNGGGFGPAYKRLTPAAKREYLAGEECADRVARGELKVAVVQQEVRRLDKECARVRGMVPTPVRLDEHERGFAFPPRADDPACRMRRAHHVTKLPEEEKVLWPFYYVHALPDRSTETYEAHLAGTLGARETDRPLYSTSESPSAIGFANLADRRGEVVSTLHPEFELAPESDAALMEEIRRGYGAGLAISGL